MCTAWVQGGDGRDELGTEEAMRVIAEAKQLGLANLKLFGGEPMLRQDLEAIVEHASGLGIRCTLITNGTLLTRQRAQSLLNAGLAQLDLSLDAGDPELHDHIRGVPGTWLRAVQGLRWMQEAAQAMNQRLAIRVNAVVMRQNYQDLPRLADSLSDLVVDEIVLNPVVPQGQNQRATSSQYVLSRQEIRHYNDEIAPKMLAAAVVHKPSWDRESLYLYGTSEQDVESARQGRYADRLQIRCCFKPWYYLIVRENGDVMGCNTVKHPLARIGNVRETTLDRIWHSEAYQVFRERCHPPQFAECSRCCYRFALVNKQIGDVLTAGGRRPPGAFFVPGAN
jgi:radical SAM protein with 4Fe4S-binding SPASM domain